MTFAVRRARWSILGLIVMVFVGTGGWHNGRHSAEGNVYERARLFESVLSTIHREYLDSLGEDTLYLAAAGALVEALGDPYAELLTGERYRQHRRQMAGNEIGAVSPEELGGKGAAYRVGPTMVHVSAASPGVLLEDGIGYVALHRMSEGSADELRAEIAALHREGMTRLILDLRLNPGGLISQGVATAGLFLAPGDTVAYSVGRRPERARAYLAQDAASWRDLPLVVLVNRGTASSAELAAAALQDHDRAVVIGTSTYGKGVLQTTYPLGDAAAVKLTTARWHAPSGRSIQRLRADSSAAERPAAEHAVTNDPARDTTTFHTAMGRVVPSGQGIVPDLLVRSNARSEPERLLLAILGPDVAIFRAEVEALAEETVTELGERAGRFEVTRAMREQLFERLVQHGIDVPYEIYNRAALYVDDQLDYEIARRALGPAAEGRQRIRSDRQLQAALTVLQRAETPAQVLAVSSSMTRRAAR